MKKKIIKDDSGTNCRQKTEETTIAKDRRRQKKERSANITTFISYPATPKVLSVETIEGFDSQNSCFVEAMPLHRVRIPSPTAKLTRGQPCSRGKKPHGHITGKRRSVMVPTTSHHQQEERVTSSQPMEQSETINKQKATKKDDSTDKLDFPNLPKPPPPSPQMLSNLNGGSSPHQLLHSGRARISAVAKKINESELLPKN